MTNISREEHHESSALHNSPPHPKSLGITVTKHVKDLYNDNFKTLNKEIEEDTRRWEYFLYSWIGRINSFFNLLFVRDLITDTEK